MKLWFWLTGEPESDWITAYRVLLHLGGKEQIRSPKIQQVEWDYMWVQGEPSKIKNSAPPPYSGIFVVGMTSHNKIHYHTKQWPLAG